MNKKAKMSGGHLILLILVGIYVVTQTSLFDEILGGEETPIGNCPSSGLTEVTINTQEALASSATNANVTYFVFDNGVLHKNGETGSDGTVSFDVECGAGKTYTALIYNEVANDGFYPEQVTIDASGPTFTINKQMYQYGGVNLVSVASNIDPAGNSNVSAGLGKECGFVITYTVNESASAFNKPLIICEANTSCVSDVTLNGVTEAPSKRPNRLSAYKGYAWYTWEVDKLVKSSDPAQKLEGSIKFSSTVNTTGRGEENMTCRIVDQATFKLANYKTMSLSEGFVEAAEDTESITDVGGPDSNLAVLHYENPSGYC